MKTLQHEFPSVKHTPTKYTKYHAKNVREVTSAKLVDPLRPENHRMWQNMREHMIMLLIFRTQKVLIAEVIVHARL